MVSSETVSATRRIVSLLEENNRDRWIKRHISSCVKFVNH
jgi:hypothetical protein